LSRSTGFSDKPSSGRHADTIQVACPTGHPITPAPTLPLPSPSLSYRTRLIVVWLVDQSGCPVVRLFVCSRFIRSFVRSFVVRSFVCSRFVCSFVRSFVVRSFVRFSYVRSFARSFVCSFARSFFRSFVRVSFICSLVRSNCSMTVWSLPYRPSHHACITTAFAVAVPVISHEVGCCVGLSVRLSLSSRHHRHQCFCHLWHH
jgi:hypothetical protein